MLTFSPVIACTTTVPRDKEILRVVQILVKSILNTVNDSWLEIDQKRSSNVMLVIRLVEKYIFTVISLCCILLKDAFSADSVLLTKLLPEFVSNYSQK